ncbi:MAG: hypothetical protein C3F15_03005 [Holophagae bacterium]|nr:MAG: hypothetical protein C3F15_03005 [Holophagae bacterium]
MRTENRALTEIEAGMLAGVSGTGVARPAVGRRSARLAPTVRRETVDAIAAGWRTTRVMVAPTNPLL